MTTLPLAELQPKEPSVGDLGRDEIWRALLMPGPLAADEGTSGKPQGVGRRTGQEAPVNQRYKMASFAPLWHDQLMDSYRDRVEFGSSNLIVVRGSYQTNPLNRCLNT